MPHIQVPPNVPGIRSLVMYRPETGQHLYNLAQILLRGESPLTPVERELIATYVSARNDCKFCMSSHAAAARVLLHDKREVVDRVINQLDTAPITKKLAALLTIAGKVQQNGKLVQEADIAAARMHGAIDRDIHDTVLIAATFSMFNRYVDGLASLTPDDPKEYDAMGERMASIGYVLPQPLTNENQNH